MFGKCKLLFRLIIEFIPNTSRNKKVLNTNRHTKRDGFVRHSNSVFNIAVSKPLHVHIIHILKFIKLA